MYSVIVSYLKPQIQVSAQFLWRLALALRLLFVHAPSPAACPPVCLSSSYQEHIRCRSAAGFLHPLVSAMMIASVFQSVTLRTCKADTILNTVLQREQDVRLDSWSIMLICAYDVSAQIAGFMEAGFVWRRVLVVKRNFSEHLRFNPERIRTTEFYVTFIL